MGAIAHQARLGYEQWTARKIRDYQLEVVCGLQGGLMGTPDRALNRYDVTVRDGRATEGWATKGAEKQGMSSAAKGTEKRSMTQREADLFTVETLFDVSRTIIARCLSDDECRSRVVQFREETTRAGGVGPHQGKISPYGDGLGPFPLRGNGGQETVIIGLNSDRSFPSSFGFETLGGLDRADDVIFIRQFHILKP